MGIESDQVVYEYLSRVGDVAHQRQLSSATRMRLVSELRNEIDRRRARTPVDSPAAVRRILDRLGSPDDVVAAADGTRAPVPQAPAAAVPTQCTQRDRPEPRDGRADGKSEPPRKGLRRVMPLPRPRSDPPQDTPAPSDSGAAGPRTGALPDWWRKDAGPGTGDDTGVLDLGDGITGFVGGIEIADMLKSPATLRREEEEARELATLRQREKERAEAEEAAEGAAAAEKKAAGPGLRRFLRPSSPRSAAPAAGTGPRWTNPLLLLAALCLVAGAVLGNWLALAVGWLIAWASRRLTDTETKLAIFGLPGLSVAAGLLWLWGRTEGRWGEPIPEGHMNDAVAETWPWVLRGAATATALFLVWRSQRQGKG